MAKFEEMPYKENPEEGYIVAANNKFSSYNNNNKNNTNNQILFTNDHDYSDPFRAQRIVEMLLNMSTRGHNVDDFLLMQVDRNVSSFFRNCFYRVLVLCENVQEKDSKKLLLNWNSIVSEDSYEGKKKKKLKKN